MTLVELARHVGAMQQRLRDHGLIPRTSREAAVWNARARFIQTIRRLGR